MSEHAEIRPCNVGPCVENWARWPTAVYGPTCWAWFGLENWALKNGPNAWTLGL